MRRFLMCSLPLCLLLACGPGEVGQSCQGGGTAENDCVDGAFCTAERSATHEVPDQPNAGETFICRQICDTNAQCLEGESCRRAAGAMISTCQPDDDDAPPME